MKIQEILSSDIRSVMISGHVNPDGDCVGSCMALYLYLKKNYPGLDAGVFLEKPRPELCFLTEAGSIVTDIPGDMPAPDLFVVLDASDPGRMMKPVLPYFQKARHTVCIDHHENGTVEAEFSFVRPEVGSCAEVLFELLEEEKLDRAVAEALYMGIIHDTGVFQYTNTRPETYEIVSKLTRFGFNTAAIIYDSFKSRSYLQSRILGFCLERAGLIAGGRAVFSIITPEEMAHFQADKSDVGIVVSSLKLIQGIDAAIFAYPVEDGMYKISIRTSENADATVLARRFHGGGHIRAAGGSFAGTAKETEEAVRSAAEEVLNASC